MNIINKKYLHELFSYLKINESEDKILLIHMSKVNKVFMYNVETDNHILVNSDSKIIKNIFFNDNFKSHINIHLVKNDCIRINIVKDGNLQSNILEVYEYVYNFAIIKDEFIITKKIKKIKDIEDINDLESFYYSSELYISYKSFLNSLINTNCYKKIIKDIDVDINIINRGSIKETISNIFLIINLLKIDNSFFKKYPNTGKSILKENLFYKEDYYYTKKFISGISRAYEYLNSFPKDLIKHRDQILLNSITNIDRSLMLLIYEDLYLFINAYKSMSSKEKELILYLISLDSTTGSRTVSGKVIDQKLTEGYFKEICEIKLNNDFKKIIIYHLYKNIDVEKNPILDILSTLEFIKEHNFGYSCQVKFQKYNPLQIFINSRYLEEKDEILKELYMIAISYISKLDNDYNIEDFLKKGKNIKELRKELI